MRTLLPDLQGFSPPRDEDFGEELANCIIYQVGALKGSAEAEGAPLNHLKPHGSLYGMGHATRRWRTRSLDAAQVFDLPRLGISRHVP